MKKTKAPWVVVTPGKKDSIAKCERCGDILRLGLPVDLGVLAAAGNAFVKAHQGCKAK